ncbi:Brix domain-containing protein 1, partial [Rozella allomycis CSF55]
KVAKTALGKRILESREPKVVENPKSVLVMKGHRTSQIVIQALNNIQYALKKPFGIHFSRKNDIKPFESETPLEFLCEKNDTSLFAIGYHTKKHPNTITMGRLFDHHILDMVELSIEQFKTLEDFKVEKCAVGAKPSIIFVGELFEMNETYRHLKNFFLDYFRGKEVKVIDLTGLEHVIVFTATEANIFMRTYRPLLLKSGNKLPRVELEEMGPRFDFKVGRTKFAHEELMKRATRQPKETMKRKKKNIEFNALGEKYGRVYVDHQDLSKLQTRKVKALKKYLSKKEDGEEKQAKKQKMDVDSE